MIPASAVSIILAVLEARHEGVTFGDIAKEPTEAHVIRARHAVWLALRAEQDERGRRRYTQQRIADWFGVTRSAINEVERRARNAAG